MNQSLPRAKKKLVVTAHQGRQLFRLQSGHVLPFWPMGQSLPGVIDTVVVTAQQFEISSGVYSRFRPPIWHLLLNQPILPCVWCSSGAVPSWHHLAWECEGFRSSRPRMPRDLLQKVLGWPVGNECNDNAILFHLSAVREKVLDRRYRAV